MYPDAAPHGAGGRSRSLAAASQGVDKPRGTNAAQEKENSEMAERIDVAKIVDVHCVIPDQHGDPFDYHTHGLEAFGHPEFQLLAPGLCRRAAVTLLLNHADAVINDGEVFAADETVSVDGFVGAYQQVPGDLEDHPPRLRIVDKPRACRCQMCRDEGRAQEPESSDHTCNLEPDTLGPGEQTTEI